MKDTVLTTTTAALAVLGFLALLIFIAPISIFFGWVTGLIVNWICGDFVTRGLNIILGEGSITRDMIPTIGGALGFIGGFFKSYSASKSKK